MFKLLIAFAFLSLAAASLTPEEKTEVEEVIFYGQQMVKAEEMLSLVDELSAYYDEHKDEKDLTDMDKWMRENVGILYMIGHVSEANCKNLSNYNNLVDRLQHYHNLNLSAGAFLVYYQEQQNNLCKQVS